MQRYALLSVWDKRGIVELARGLVELGFDIISTGGTGRALAQAGVAFTPVEELTGFPEALGGRLKTLSPVIFGGILFRRKDQAEEAQGLSLPRVDLVAVNLYPFEEVAKAGRGLPELIENIDIGGPSLIRAAAKNYEDVVVLVDPDDYRWVLDELRRGGPGAELRAKLALKAFARTASYDATIYNALWPRFEGGPPDWHIHAIPKFENLRYGENPHQRGAVYGPRPLGVRQLSGPPLSYNNYLDVDGVLGLLSEFPEPAGVVFKHLSPSGAAVAEDGTRALMRAWEADPLSAFGGVLGVNRRVEPELARWLADKFWEVLVAPDYHPEALKILEAKKRRRVLLQEVPKDTHRCCGRYIAGGFIVSEEDTALFGEFRQVAGEPLAPDEKEDLVFAWKVAKHTLSNAIVVAKGGTTLGIGRGQASRVGAVEWALRMAGEGARGAVLASDGFFPFPDSVELAAGAGIRAIIQPGGSIRDDEVIEAAERLGVKMVFTGMRHFKH